MVKRYYADPDQDIALTNAHIRQIAAEMIAALIANSELTIRDQPIISYRVKKIRNRAKVLTQTEYVIIASIAM